VNRIAVVPAEAIASRRHSAVLTTGYVIESPTTRTERQLAVDAEVPWRVDTVREVL
jgi:hypothetical protein